jgi:hypothetical protein
VADAAEEETVPQDANPFGGFSSGHGDGTSTGPSENPFSALPGANQTDRQPAPPEDARASSESDQLMPGTGFAGFFLGDINGIPAVIELQAAGGNRLTGTFTLAIQEYPVSATVDGATAKGRLPNDGGDGEFEATVSGETLQWKMTLLLPGSPKPSWHTFQFRRGTAAEAQAATAEQRDQRLVGRWRYTETAIEVTDYWLFLNPDGTFRWGDRKHSGGEYWEGGWTSEGAVEGRWRTVGRAIYILPDGTKTWQLYAHYEVNESAMLLKHPDGSQLLWQRA